MAEKGNMLQRNATCPDIFVFGARILMGKKCVWKILVH